MRLPSRDGDGNGIVRFYPETATLDPPFMTFYAVSSYVHQHRANIPSRPVASGFSVSDHVANQPVTITMKLKVGDYQETGDKIHNRHVQLEWLSKLYAQKIGFKVVSKIAYDLVISDWSNFYITDMSPAVDPRSITTYDVQLTIKQVRVAKLETVTIQSIPGEVHGSDAKGTGSIDTIVITQQLEEEAEDQTTCSDKSGLANLSCRIKSWLVRHA